MKKRSSQLFAVGYVWIASGFVAPLVDQPVALSLGLAWATFLTGWIVETIERVHRKPEIRMTITGDRSRE